MPYLIDGHNLLRAIQSDDERFAPVADTELCCALDRYLASRGDCGILVFDGTGPINKGLFYSLCHLRVIFAGADIEADDIIETQLQDLPNAKRWTVVSNDRRVRRAAQRARAERLHVDLLWETVVAFQRRKPRKHEPTSKRVGLNAKETDQWMKTFGLDGRQPKTGD
ncbi:NYN domain-containing protein [Planctomycetota bacterium]